MLTFTPFIRTELLTIFYVLVGSVMICLKLPSEITTPLIPAVVINTPFIFFSIVFGFLFCVTFAFKGALENYKSIYFNIMLIIGLSLTMVLIHGFIESMNRVLFPTNKFGEEVLNIQIKVKQNQYEPYLQLVSVITLIFIFPLALRTGNLITQRYQVNV